MTSDLFGKSNKERVYDFIRERGYVRSSFLQSFGTQSFINEPGRYARHLKSDGRVRRLDKQEKIFRFGGCREEIWTLK